MFNVRHSILKFDLERPKLVPLWSVVWSWCLISLVPRPLPPQEEKGLVHKVLMLSPECHVDDMNIIMGFRTLIPKKKRVRWTRLGSEAQSIMVIWYSSPSLQILLAFYVDGLRSILACQPEVHVDSFQCHDIIVLQYHWTFLILRNSPRIWTSFTRPFLVEQLMVWARD